MKIIIFAGGTGKRFWPLSRKNAPKQFLPVVDNKPLIKLKYEYLRLGFEPKDIFVSTGAQYENEVKTILSELPEENFIFEPEMKDNGPAVAYAISYVNKAYPNEVLSTQWSDHYIKKPEIFIRALKEAEQIVKEKNKSIVIGVQARSASPHRGYIKFGNKIKSLDKDENIILSEFIRFVEKPTQEVAKEYIASGDYAWNPAYFVSTYELIMQKYKDFAPSIYSVIREIANNDFSESAKSEYLNLKRQAFDYIFSENLNPDEALVINARMGWSDVGELISLKETLEESSSANVVIGKNVDIGSTDCLIYNKENDELIATINLHGLVIVNTKDVVAIFPKEDNVNIKKYLKKLEEEGFSEYL